MQSNASCIDQDKTILFLIALPEMDQTDLKQCSTIYQPAGPGVETLPRGTRKGQDLGESTALKKTTSVGEKQIMGVGR